MTGFPDILIVGGGVVGAACARELAGWGASVRLIERGGEAGEAWRASAGLLPPQIEVPVDDPLFGFGIAGRDFYSEVAESLRESTGIDIGLSQGGILQLAGSEPEAETLRARVAWQRALGQAVEWLAPDVLHDDWPRLAPAFGALHAPRDGYLNPVRLVEALRAEAVRLGVELVEDAIVAIEHDRGRVTGVRGRARHPAGQVVLACGAWSGRIAGLPKPLSIEPVRGQLITYPSPQPIAPVFGQGCYVLPRGSEMVAGSTMEYVGFAAEVSEIGVASIRRRAEALLPELRQQTPVRAWAGLRPGSPDGKPIIGAEPEVGGLWYATGHGRNGILYAGVTGQLVRQLMVGEPTLPGVELFRPERFWSW